MVYFTAAPTETVLSLPNPEQRGTARVRRQSGHMLQIHSTKDKVSRYRGEADSQCKNNLSAIYLCSRTFRT